MQLNVFYSCNIYILMVGWRRKRKTETEKKEKQRKDVGKETKLGWNGERCTKKNSRIWEKGTLFCIHKHGYLI